MDSLETIGSATIIIGCKKRKTHTEAKLIFKSTVRLWVGDKMLSYINCQKMMSTCRDLTKGKPMDGPSGWKTLRHTGQRMRHGNNTRMHQRELNDWIPEEGDANLPMPKNMSRYFTVTYWGNTIANIYSDGWELFTQGWETWSTKARLNIMLHPHIQIKQKDGEWRFYGISGAPTSGGIHRYDDFHEGVFVSAEHPSKNLVWYNRAVFRLFQLYLNEPPTWLMPFHAKEIAKHYAMGYYSDSNLKHIHLEWYKENEKLVNSLYTDDTDRHGMTEFFAFLEKDLDNRCCCNRCLDYGVRVVQ